MFSMPFLLQLLGPQLVSALRPEAIAQCPARLELLCDQPRLTADRLYLGTAASVPLIETIEAESGTLLLLSDGTVGQVLSSVPPQCSLLLLSCPLPQLYNLLGEALAQAVRWQQAFQRLSSDGGGLHAMVTLTAQLSGCAVLLLDTANRVVAGGGMGGAIFLPNQVAGTGALPACTARLILPEDGTEHGTYAVPNTNLLIYSWRMVTSDGPIGALLLERRDPGADVDLRTLCHCAMDSLYLRLGSRDLNRLGSSTREFQRLWRDIVEQRLVESMDIRQALERFPYPVEQFHRVIVLSFPGGGVPYNYLLARLREIFPRANMAVYEREVLILYTYPERTFCQSLPGGDLLQALLTRYQGFAGVSNGTRHLSALCSIYFLARRTLLLAQALRKSRDERVFFHEDYSMYCVIDLCAQRFLEGQGHNDILYLIHPAVLHLTRFDRDHANNLRDVLYYYLLNDRNLVKTAAATYMHRNTVINKVNKILELLGLDLEDGTLRQRLMFSCQVIRYYENVLKRSIQL